MRKPAAEEFSDFLQSVAEVFRQVRYIKEKRKLILYSTYQPKEISA